MRDVINEARMFHEEHKMKIGRDYRLEFLKLSKEDIYDFLETKYGDYIHVWRQKLHESEIKEKQLQKFKDYVHDRLDKMNIPTHPEGEHSKAGCRIGDRLDIIEKQIQH